MYEDFCNPAQADNENSQPAFRNTYTLVSAAAYLLGVPKHIFENEYESPKMEIYNSLELNKHARIIRNLCLLRNAIERNFGIINEKMHFEYAGLTSLSDYIPIDAIEQLSKDGIQILHSNYRLVQYVIELNQLIMDRINNCKNCFPMWLNWQYIKNIFIMPDGLSEEGCRTAASLYYTNKNRYPYKVYLNWVPDDQGNILYNDKKFVLLLYQWNHDEFTDLSKVCDTRSDTKGNIYDFLDDSEKTVIVVDCENSDPYRFCNVLNDLDTEYTEKISKIILFDDIHTATAWEILDQYTKIPIERILIERIKQNKSLVDIRLTADTCREFYRNNADSFILVSSDSDYWGLISSMPDAKFIVMMEREKCGPNIKFSLSSAGIFYCFIDDFYSGDNNDMQLSVLLREANKYLEKEVCFNMKDLMDYIFRSSRIQMSDVEKRRFYERCIKPMRLSVEAYGTVKIELKSWT